MRVPCGPILILGALALGGCEKLPEPALAPVLESADPVLQKILEKYRPALSLKGDVVRGREIFAKSCLHCHRMGTQGHELGPDVSEFRTRTPGQLLLDMVDPSREVKPEYLSVRILTAAGELIDGMLVSQNASKVTLKRAAGESDTVLRGDIQKMTTTKYSVMPEGLEEAFDLQQTADLIAFMRWGDSK